ncbi:MULTISPECIES: glycosyl hydrolase family 18 protein [Saccharibacillus]|uniref:glycosyl hydrolase family 18 protein n=1 Tax=Saccharibacillus TaxID=456492 RepID=UPI0012388911|nr:glycosyl hydrolase family 18 protein [Saccharibacillus sp. WB 17]MWJ33776.1 hypothetical protein [Saccharibacillus sp. WB 17]
MARKHSWLAALLTLAFLLPTLIMPASPAQAAGTATDRWNRVSVGYYTNWSTYDRTYQVSQLPAGQLTHINYAFATVNADGTVASTDVYADMQKSFAGDVWSECEANRCGNFKQLELLKANNPHLRTLISIGGWTLSKNFPAVMNDAAKRATFVSSAAAFMKNHKFDGIDIDWEFPGVTTEETPAGPNDKANFALMLKELRAELDKSVNAQGEKYLLTLAVGPAKRHYDGLDVGAIRQYADWMNIMAYDYYVGGGAPWGANAPLYGDSRSAATPDDMSVSAQVDRFLGGGLPSNQIVMGLPYYGRGFAGVSGADPVNTPNAYQNASSATDFGTWEKGVFDYSDLAKNYIGKNGYTRYWNSNTKTPYLYNPSKQVVISYDDETSLQHKVGYAVDHNLRGTMLWEMSGDRDNVLNMAQYAALRGVNDLSELNVQLGSNAAAAVPGFTPGQLDYLIAVPASAASVAIYPRKLDSTAVVTVNGVATRAVEATDRVTVPLNGKQTTIPVSVQGTAAGKTSTKTYTLQVVKSDAPAAVPAKLSALSLSSGTLTPAFSPEVANYAAQVSAGTASVRVTPTTSVSGAVIRVNGTVVASGQASAELPLTAGENPVPVTVTGTDGTVQSYRVTVTRAQGEAAPALSGLKLTPDAALDPVFDPAVTGYTVYVPNTVSSITVTPTSSGTGSTVQVKGTNVASGQPSAAQTLAVGRNVIDVAVRNASGAARTYQLTVIRATTQTASLSAMSVAGQNLLPAFSTGTSAYTVNVGADTPEMILSATAADPAAMKMTLNGRSFGGTDRLPLRYGPNTFQIVVDTQDGLGLRKIYDLTVNRTVRDGVYVQQAAGKLYLTETELLAMPLKQRTALLNGSLREKREILFVRGARTASFADMASSGSFAASAKPYTAGDIKPGSYQRPNGKPPIVIQ